MSLSDIRKDNFDWKKIKDVNLDVDYIEKFVPIQAANELMRIFESEFIYFSGRLSMVKVFGKWHQIPRKQVAYGDKGLHYKYSGNVIPALPWPDSLDRLRNILRDVFGHHYNFVLVNRYKDGIDCIGEHKDDEKELDVDVPIASLSFGQTRDFVLKSVTAKKSYTISLNHGDLLFMNPPTNKFWNHSIPRRKNLPGVRISLTFRKLIEINDKKPNPSVVTSPYFKKTKKML